MHELRRILVSPRIAGLQEHDGEVVGTAPWPKIIVLGAGYYRRVEDVMALVDTASLVEVIPLPPRPQETTVSDLDAARVWAKEITAHNEATGWLPEDVTVRAVERGELCGVRLDLGHPGTDIAHCVLASAGGWVVGYDGSVDAWTAR